MIIEIPDRSYTTEELISLIDDLQSVVPCFSRLYYNDVKLWRLISQRNISKIVRRYIRAIESASLPPTDGKWWPQLNPPAAIAVRVRLYFTGDILKSLGYSRIYTRKEMFDYLIQLMTSNWEIDGFDWLITRRGKMQLYPETDNDK